MTTFTTDASRALGGPDWLAARRLAAAEQLEELTWPTSTEEIWRYSAIDGFDPDRFSPISAEELGNPGVEPAPGGGLLAAEAGERSGLIVVRNGRVVHHELDPALEARGVHVCGLATCAAGEAEPWLGVCSDASPDPFTVLHDAFLAGGAFVSVPAGVVVDKPIVVLHWSQGDGRASFPHTLVVAGEASEVSVVDRFASAGGAHLVDAVVELVLGDGANVRYLSVQEHGPATWQIALQRAHLGRDAHLRSSAVALGGDYARLRSESRLDGSGAESDLLAVYFGDGTQTLDFRTLQDHVAPRTRSNLLFKGAVEHEAHSVYSGLVHLRSDAQHSEAYQTNRNLVLSEGAGAESVPNLEIEANDVKCAHASTVGPVDDDQRYYLATRGVPPEEADRLIVMGFFEDVIAKLPVRSLVEPLREAVTRKIEHRGGSHG